ncbi:MAG: deoxynucleoside kinase [Archaeoglobaceae archaeon]
MKIISFEGCVGAGKTSLTNYFSYEFGLEKILEKFEVNPFLKEFYGGTDVNLETETTFLLIHYSQLKEAIQNSNSSTIISDFSIEKDLVYAKMNLKEEEHKIFLGIYNHIIEQIGVPDTVIYLDISLKVLKRRIFQRGRYYEINADPNYFKRYFEEVKGYFQNETRSKVYFFNVDDLVLEPEDQEIEEIREKILEAI